MLKFFCQTRILEKIVMGGSIENLESLLESQSRRMEKSHDCRSMGVKYLFLSNQKIVVGRKIYNDPKEGKKKLSK